MLKEKTYIDIDNVRHRCLLFIAEAASAPEAVENYIPGDTSGLQAFDGYGDIGFGTGGYVPPPPPPSYDQLQPPSMEFGR